MSDTPLFSRYCFNGDESLESLSDDVIFIFGGVSFEDFGGVCFEDFDGFDDACFDCLDFDFGGFVGFNGFFDFGGDDDFAGGVDAGFFLLIKFSRWLLDVLTLD